MQNLTLDKQLTILINESISKRVFISIMFAIISITILMVGAYWPKKYESQTSILWSNRDSLSPLLRDGVAETTTLSEQAAIAREVILSNKALEVMINKAGLNIDADGKDLDQRQLEVLKGELREKIRVHNRGRNLIIVSYRHENPEISYLVVSILSELLIQETREVKNKSSQGAYDFIDRQVQDYKNKLDRINNRIIDFRKSNVDLDSDTRTGVNNRVNGLKSLIRDTSLELTEIRVQKRSLQEQLALEKTNIENQLMAESIQASAVERQSANSERLLALQNNLDTLRLSYTESYPDIIQLKEQIMNLKLSIKEEKLKSTRVDKTVNSQAVDINFVASPLYSRLSGEIANAETLIQTLEARITDANERLSKELLRSSKVNALESQLEEMTRDLDVTQEIYDDLLTRRENARVSLNLQLENQGSTFKIQEPAIIPLVPVGFRFLHFVVGSAFIGLMAPLGLIYILLFLDPRIRHEDSLDDEILQIPVIGTIEHYANDADSKAEKRKTILSVAIMGFSILILSMIALLKMNQFIGT